MKFLVDGFGEYADTLHFKSSRIFRLEDVKNILNITGVEYIYIQSRTVGVRYNELDTAEGIAAQCLKVLGNDGPTEFIVRDGMMSTEKKAQTTETLRLELMLAEAPTSLKHHPVRRGTPPAYYLA